LQLVYHGAHFHSDDAAFLLLFGEESVRFAGTGDPHMRRLLASVAFVLLAGFLWQKPSPTSPDPEAPRPIEALDTVFIEDMTWTFLVSSNIMVVGPLHPREYRHESRARSAERYFSHRLQLHPVFFA
jgi:hypothetical protein